MKQSDSLSWLELPPRDMTGYVNNSLLHGGGKVAAAYVGLRAVPESIKGVWMHGWLPDFICELDPDMPFGEQVAADAVRYVASKGHEKYLADSGYPARAIGLPIAYLPPKTYARRPGSLLVMPVHSETSTTHQWQFAEYADQIAALKPHFETVVACVHTSCITNGYWVNEFESIGVPVIEGAHGCDRNSLERICALASQFEFVTTNGFGSHIVYGSVFGAKASIYGDFCTYTEDDCPDLYRFALRPGLLEKLVESLSEKSIRSVLGEFFVHPREAKQRVEWGLGQIGYQNRITPAEMRKSFGWEWYRGPLEKVKKKTAHVSQLVSRRVLTSRMRAALQERSDPALKARNAEIRRLQNLPPDRPGTALLDDEEFHFLRAKDFAEEYRRVFEEEACAFLSVKASPVIIDWGAGVGIPLRFWARKYPAPEIHAYAASGDERECLQKNAALVKNGKVVLHEKPSDLGELLQGDIDFLRINLGPDSAEALVALGGKLKSVKRCLVVCRTDMGEDQSLSRVLALMESCGFRYHLQSPGAAPNPLVFLPIKENADCAVNVWGYQGEKFPNALRETVA
jgi:hypothetical protein